VNDQSLTRLRQLIVDYFSDDELRTLCFGLRLNYDALPAMGTHGKAREVILALGKQSRLPELVAYVRQVRPNLTVDDIAPAGTADALTALAAESASSGVTQIAIGSYIAQAAPGGTATVNVYNITHGMDKLATRYDGHVRNFLDYYLGAPGKPAPFGGRADDMVRLDAWLRDPGAAPCALLVAPAGRGKSALLAHWVAQLADDADHRVHVVYFPISIRYNTNLETVTFASLAARMAALHDELVTQTADAGQYRGVFVDYLQRPLPDGGQLLVVLDGLDEAAGWEAGADLFPATPPEHLRVVVATRPLAGDTDERAWLSRLGWEMPGRAICWSLDRLTGAGVADVLVQMGNPLEVLAAQVDVVGQLYELSEGDPLLVRLYVEALLPFCDQAAVFSPQDLLTLKPGLKAYFDRWFEEQRKLWGASKPLQDRAVRGLLDLCATAMGPLTRADMLALTPDYYEDDWVVKEAVQAVRRFVVGDGIESGYVFSHPRLAEYFSGEMSPARRAEWQGRFLKYGYDTLAALEAGTLEPKEVSSYAVKYYGAHLERARAPMDALVTPVWLQAWEALTGSHNGFLNDVGRAWTAANHASALAMQIRCALAESTIHSLAEHIPTELFANVLDFESDLIAPDAILARISQLPQVWQRSDALFDLAPHLPETVLPTALDMALDIAMENERGILSLASRLHLLPKLLGEALRRLPGCLNSFGQTWFLEAVANTLPRHLVELALATARQIPDADARAIALGCLIGQSPADQRQEHVAEALQAAGHTGHLFSRAKALAYLATYITPQQLEEIWQAPWTPSCESVGMGWEGEDEGRYIWLAYAYARSGQVDRALSTMKHIHTNDYRHQAISKVAPDLVPSLAMGQLADLFHCLPWDQHKFDYARALGVIGRYCSADLLPHVLDAARATEDRACRLLALGLIAPSIALPETQTQVWREVTTLTEQFNQHLYEWDRWTLQAYKEIVEHAPTELVTGVLERLRDSLTSSRGQYEWPWSQVALASLNKLSPSLKQQICIELMAEARESGVGEGWLDKLAPHISTADREELFRIAFRQAQHIGDERQQNDTLVPYLAFISNVWKARESHYYVEEDHVRVLLSLASCSRQPEQRAALALRAAESFGLGEMLAFYPRDVISVLPFLEEGQQRAIALKFIEAGEADEVHPQKTVVNLMPLVTNTRGEARKHIIERLFTLTREMPVNSERIFLSCKMLGYLKHKDRQAVLAELAYWYKSGIEEFDLDAFGQRYEASHFQPLSLRTAIAWSLPVEAVSWKERMGLLDQMSNALAEIETDTAEIDQYALRLVQVASVLPLESARPLFDRAASLALRAKFGKGHRGFYHSNLLPWLPIDLWENILVESLRDASLEQDHKARPHLLINLMTFWIQLPLETVRRIWQETLPLLASHDRKMFLGDLHSLAPVILKLGGEQALQTTQEEISRVTGWWP